MLTHIPMHTYIYSKDKETMVCAEGMYTGQFVYCGAKAQVTVGNVLPLSALPEGTIICNVEGAAGNHEHFKEVLK
jgi:large subunit ribosomal protein L8e